MTTDRAVSGVLRFWFRIFPRVIIKARARRHVMLLCTCFGGIGPRPDPAAFFIFYFLFFYWLDRISRFAGIPE